jgi:hypothetical protein
MAKKIDLTGQRFGRLVVLEDVDRTKDKRVIWRCQCECGNFVNVISNSLQQGDTQSCGCLKRERASEANYKDLTGQRFGRLIVLEDVGRTKNRKVIWRCQCDCGSTVEVESRSLQSGKTQSCGCYKREQTSKRSRIDLTGQVFGRLTVLEDVGRTKPGQVIWRCLCECGNTVDIIAGHLQSGNTQSCGCLHKEQMVFRQSGENNWNWKGGITSLNQMIRNCVQYTEWRTLVFQRDNFTCSHCNARGVHLIAHHIKFFSTLMKEHNITTLEEATQCEALWNTDNGITLCKECHKKLHQDLKIKEEMDYYLYGNKN